MEWGSSPLLCGQSKSSRLHWNKKINRTLVLNCTVCGSVYLQLNIVNSKSTCGLLGKNPPCTTGYILYLIRLQRCLKDKLKVLVCDFLYLSEITAKQKYRKVRLRINPSGLYKIRVIGKTNWWKWVLDRINSSKMICSVSENTPQTPLNTASTQNPQPSQKEQKLQSCHTGTKIYPKHLRGCAKSWKPFCFCARRRGELLPHLLQTTT